MNTKFLDGKSEVVEALGQALITIMKTRDRNDFRSILVILNYNANGKEDGPWLEWWKNGNKKAEYTAKKGHIISGTEYYQDGKPRVRYRKREMGGGLSSPMARTVQIWGFSGRYKDGLMIKGEKLDSIEIAKWPKPRYFQ